MPEASAAAPMIRCDECGRDVPALPSRDSRHVIRACDRHGNKLVPIGGPTDVPAPQVTPPSNYERPSTPPPTAEDWRRPAIGPGQVMAEHAIGQCVACDCCNGVAIIKPAQGRNHVMRECNSGRKLLRNYDPVTVVATPDVLPDSRPLYMRR